MAFGMSGSKSSTKTTAESEAEARSRMEQGYTFDEGGNVVSGGESGYAKDSGAEFQQGVFGGPEQQQRMQNMNNMWGGFMGPGGGQQQVQSGMMNANPYMQQVAQGAMPGYQSLMGGGASGRTGAAIDPALRSSLEASMRDPSQTGKMYESIVGGAGNTYIDPMIDAMRNDEMTRQGRSAAGIASGAVGSGQSGSSRQGIAEGLMRSEGNRALSTQESMARMGGYDKDLDWKMRIAQQADLGRGQAQDRAIGLLGRGDTNTATGMQGAQGMQNLGMGMMAPGMQAAMMPFQMAQMYGNSMGGPTVLGGGSQYDKGTGYGNTDYTGSQWNTGTGFGTGESSYDASNKYSSKGKSMSGGFGF